MREEGQDPWGLSGESQPPTPKLRGWVSEPTREGIRQGRQPCRAVYTCGRCSLGVTVCPGSSMACCLQPKAGGATTRVQTGKADKGQIKMGSACYAKELTFYSRSC